jgi:hypothetical protein
MRLLSQAAAGFSVSGLFVAELFVSWMCFFRIRNDRTRMPALVIRRPASQNTGSEQMPTCSNDRPGIWQQQFAEEQQ